MKWYHLIDLKEVQAEYGSPVWIVSEEQLLRNISEIASFTTKKENILYPVKANPSLAVMELIAAAGVAADCASLPEINLALFCGIPYPKIVYNSPHQDLKICLMLLKNGATVVLDDWHAIGQLESMLAGSVPAGSIWLRVNPLERPSYSTATDNQGMMSHGSFSSKFGLPEETLGALFAKTRLKISGLHVHVGTQMDNLESFKKGLSSLYRIAEMARKHGHEIQAIDIGGGLGIAFTDADKFPSIQEWADALNAIKDEQYEHYAEPGHALVGNAIGLMTQIQTIKESRGKKWAVCDVGTDQLAKITLLKWPHKVFAHSGQYLPMSGKDVLAGPMCFAGDVLLHETDLAETSIGDPLLVTNAGAYTYSLSNSFNGRTAPPWLLFSKGVFRLVTDREKSFNHIFLQHHYWHRNHGRHVSQEALLDIGLVRKLQSEYVNKTEAEDEYDFVEAAKVGDKTYRFSAKLHSPVGFVSMPFAVRVFGDAAIVTVLYEMGLSEKDRPVWGDKLDLEYFANLPIEERFDFIVELSERVKYSAQKSKVLVSFSTVCGSIRGALAVSC
jgi:diaminopimelate decarboxylase